MSDRDKQNNPGDLIDIKSLIGDADGGDFSLDDIMAEFGHPPAPEEPEDLPREPEEAAPLPPGKMVAFPGPGPLPEEPEEPDRPERVEDERFPPEEPPEAQPENITPFPKKRGRLSALVHDLTQKADD